MNQPALQSVHWRQAVRMECGLGKESPGDLGRNKVVEAGAA